MRGNKAPLGKINRQESHKTMREEKLKDPIIKKLRQTPIVQIVCERVGISRATYYRWRKKYPEFKKKTNEAIQEGLLLVNDMAESQLISAIKDKNMSAITFWLRNHHLTYSNRLEITAKLKREDEKLTPEEEVLVEKALKLASLGNNKLLKQNKYESNKRDNK